MLQDNNNRQVLAGSVEQVYADYEKRAGKKFEQNEASYLLEMKVNSRPKFIIESSKKEYDYFMSLEEKGRAQYFSNRMKELNPAAYKELLAAQMQANPLETLFAGNTKMSLLLYLIQVLAGQNMSNALGNARQQYDATEKVAPQETVAHRSTQQDYINAYYRNIKEENVRLMVDAFQKNFPEEAAELDRNLRQRVQQDEEFAKKYLLEQGDEQGEMFLDRDPQKLLNDFVDIMSEIYPGMSEQKVAEVQQVAADAIANRPVHKLMTMSEAASVIASTNFDKANAINEQQEQSQRQGLSR
ncbi:MAG: hypothetical protein II886_07570 [Prevotella sp.]|nr:hypothetical protein [Prevotella sp.]